MLKTNRIVKKYFIIWVDDSTQYTHTGNGLTGEAVWIYFVVIVKIHKQKQKYKVSLFILFLYFSCFWLIFLFRIFVFYFFFSKLKKMLNIDFGNMLSFIMLHNKFGFDVCFFFFFYNLWLVASSLLSRFGKLWWSIIYCDCEIKKKNIQPA